MPTTLDVRSAVVPYRTTLRTGGGHTLVADEPLADGGLDTGPSPYDLLLASLGACTSITLRMYAARKQWPLEQADVRLTFLRDEAGVPVIQRELVLGGPLTEEQRARLTQIANQCPLHKLLSHPLAISTTLTAAAP